MATIAVAKLGFFPIPPPTYSKRIRFRTYSSSITNKTSEQGIIKFNEHENRHIDALIGVQGRGRSAPPQQLQIVKRDGQLRFLVDIVLGLRFSMSGTYQKVAPKKYEVKMDDAAIVAGSFVLPIEMLSKFNMELKYADDKLRITTGYNNIVFVHLRVQSP